MFLSVAWWSDRVIFGAAAILTYNVFDVVASADVSSSFVVDIIFNHVMSTVFTY